ncbi:MAG: hypothetical protein Q9182_001884 [Xanthomendoza sp. 2 TL-2023]
MDRHGNRIVQYYDLEDDSRPMETEREDSPATIVGDELPARRFVPQSSAEIIDLEALNTSIIFHLDDFMTDEEFRASFPNVEDRSKGDDKIPLDSDSKVIDSWSAHGHTYRRGKTAELCDGDFIRIVHVLQNPADGAISLQGFRLRRLSKFPGLFDQHLNELVILIEEMKNQVQNTGSALMDTAGLSEVLRLRKVILTNAAYPYCSCKTEPLNKTMSRESIRETGTLVCRWKMVVCYRPSSRNCTSRIWVEKSIVRLRANEADPNLSLDDEHLRTLWRGSTSKGGACPGWLPGEEAFNTTERRAKEDNSETIFNTKFDRFRENSVETSKGHRYTFGDAFCGAGGASRGAKEAGYRVEWGFDSDLAAIQAYSENFFAARCEATPADIFVSSIDDNFRVDVLHLSPPCQPYSPAHTRPGRNDEANQATFFAVGEIIKKTKPRVVTLENTFGLAERWPEWLNAMVCLFTALGFSIRWRVFNLADPGEKLPVYPQPTFGPGLIPFTTINDAIQKIPLGFADHDLEGVARRNLPPYDGDVPLRNCITTGGSLDVHPSGMRSFTNRDMTPEKSFKELKGEVSSALVKTTRTAGQIASEDLPFQRSINPEFDRLLDRQNKRLLSLVRGLNKTATAGSGTAPPKLHNLESVEDGWRGMVDIVDNLLEKADACLDEFTGAVKKLSPNYQSEAPPTDPKRPLSRREYCSQNLPKPQQFFRKVPKNDETTPFKPLLQSKPNALVALEESLVLSPAQDGPMHYNHPYEKEIIQSSYPDTAYLQDEPKPYLPFESTAATWVDTPEAVQDMLRDLRNAKEIAVDVEHHDLHTYVGLVSLMQISTREKDWIVDTLVPWREDLQVLNEVFTDPQIIKVLHGSNSDILWLQRDLGLYIVGLFDTFHASKLLGYPKHGLAYLLHRFVNFETDKRYQMADWRMRPLPEQMYDYARSDTHFLLYIFDRLRNELLAKSHPRSPNGSLVDNVRDLSKGEALQRYERQFYDGKMGSGINGWYSLLVRSPVSFNREQLAVFRAIHQWRDRIARQKDESLLHILSNQCIFTIAREMPTTLPDLLGCCHPISSALRTSVPELVFVIQKAKREGATGPEQKDLMKPRGHTHVKYGTALPASSSPIVDNVPPANGALPSSDVTRTKSPAALSLSHFWGSTIDGGSLKGTESADGNPAEEPCLALPLPPLTAEIFKVEGLGEEHAPNLVANDPGARAEHQYTKKRKPHEDDIFVVKEMGSAKKQKMSISESAPESIVKENGAPGGEHPFDGDAAETEIPLHDAEDDVEAQEKARRKRERKLQRKAKRQQQKEKKLVGTGVDKSGGAEDEGIDAFDYENAPSVLHAPQEKDRPGKSMKGVDPYAKSLNAPKGMRKVQKEGPGRSMTYKN